MRTRDGTRAAKQAPVTLTPRQEEVMRLLRSGKTNGEIAAVLGITLDGAKFHVAEIISKLGASSREDAVEIWQSRPARRWPLAVGWLKWAGLAGGAAAGLGAAVVWAAVLRSDAGPAGSSAAEETAPIASATARVQELQTLGLVDCPVPTGLGPPGSGGFADWVDFVNFDGIHYLSGFHSAEAGTGTALTLGAPYGRVEVTVSDTAAGSPGLQDCYAGYLPVGTILYRIGGYDPHFRIATADGKVYQAYGGGDSATAGEFIDIGGKTTEIRIADTGGRLLAVLSEPGAVNRLVAELLASKYDQSAPPSSGEVFPLRFQLKDGTAWDANFYAQGRLIWPGIYVSDYFVDTILAAIGR